MNEQDFQLLRDVVLGASTLPIEEREAFLVRVLEREDLRAEARALLSIDTSGVDRYSQGGVAHLVADAFGTEDSDPELGTQLGPYTLEQVLGRGGMGLVYRARQREPLERVVALKLLRAHALSPLSTRRFELEQHLLGRLDHPNIAKVLDASQTRDGRPYFVLEYVDGVPISAYCAQNRLAVRDRIVLFLQVCRAVDHAHRRGVVHRDLKPSNILVAEHDGQPVVKVIDFGIARVLEELGAEGTLATIDGHILGTPNYMSPEQARGDRARVDTRSDLYSLGVVLHEILTAELPYDLQTTSAIEALRVVTQEPARVAKMASTGQALPPDLRTILLCALDSEPERRYATVRHLADDLERFLDQQPLLARRPSSAYVLRKIAERHRVAVSLLAALVFVSIGAAIALASLYQRQVQAGKVAAREADRVGAVLDYVQKTLASSGPLDGGPDRTVGEVLTDAVQNAQTEFAERPDLRALILRSLGVSLGSNDRWKESEEALHAAFEASQRVEPADVRLSAEIQLSLAALARSTGHGSAQLDHARRGLAMLGSRLDAYPALGDGFYSEMGNALRALGALAAAESVAAVHRDFVLRHWGPDSEEYAHALASSAEVLHEVGKSDQALPFVQASIQYFERNGGDATEGLLRGLNLLGVIQNDRGDKAAAIGALRRALRIVTDVFGPDHSRTAELESNLATALMESGELREAEPHARDALRIWRLLFGDGHPHVATAHNNLGYLLMNYRRFGDAERHLERSIVLHDSLGVSPADLWMVRANLAFNRIMSGRSARARAELEELAQEQEELAAAGDRRRFYTFFALANALLELGEDARALDLCDSALAKLSGATEPVQQRYTERFFLVRTRASVAAGSREWDRSAYIAARAALLADDTPLATDVFEVARGEAMLRTLGEVELADENRRWLRARGVDGDWPGQQ